MNYPSGIRPKISNINEKKNPSTSMTNRGMELENDINYTNEYYLNINKAVIHKKPTPIQIVNVNYPKRSAAVITEGYFKQPSTTDYNGLYKGHYIDFEAKETNSLTSFPFNNIHEHQINHMRSILEHDGISFFIIKFTKLDETYLINSEFIIKLWTAQFDGGRKSVTYQCIKENGYLIPFKYPARIDYLSILDQIYF